MRGLFLLLAAVPALFIFGARAEAQENKKGVYFTVEASVAYALQNVSKQGAYHSVLVSPQATVYYGERYGKGPFLTLGDALFSSIVGGPSDAKPTEATKLSANQVYALVGYRFHITDPATSLNIGIGYLNQKIDVPGNKYGGGPFFSIGITVPIFDAAL